MLDGMKDYSGVREASSTLLKEPPISQKRASGLVSAYRTSLRRGTFILKAIKQLSAQYRNAGRLHCSCLVNILLEGPSPVRNDTTPAPTSCRWNRFWRFASSGTLGGVGWLEVTDVSGQHIGPISNGQAVQEPQVCLLNCFDFERRHTCLRSGSNGDPIKMNRMVNTLPTTNTDGLRLTQSILSPIYSTDHWRRAGGSE